MHMIGVSSIDCCTADFSTRGQVRYWLFDRSSSILRTLRAIFLSNAALAFILKQTELTDEVFSNPSALPISLCLCPPTLRHKYIAIDRASFCSPRRFLLSSSKGLPYALAVTRAICPLASSRAKSGLDPFSADELEGVFGPARWRAIH